MMKPALNNFEKLVFFIKMIWI